MFLTQIFPAMILLLVFNNHLAAQKTSSKNTPILSFIPSENFDTTTNIHFCDTLIDGEVGVFHLAYKNTGSLPLIIDIKTSGGPNIPSYTREPVLPGNNGQIRLHFHTRGRFGRFSKSFFIHCHGAASKTLTITGYILRKTETGD